MTQTQYNLIEQYMLSCMGDSAHDKEHIYRVLYTALDIAASEEKVDHDILICACLLHDIGRMEQFADPSLCHARVGAEKAYKFLVENGFEEEFARQVKDCVQTHRFRADNPPRSIEAKILFDADKVDVCGAIGIARTLVYKGRVSEPLYSLDENGQVSDGSNDTEYSFFQEYKYKLEGLYDKFFTARGKEIAEGRRATAIAFYESMLKEVQSAYEPGSAELKKYLK